MSNLTLSSLEILDKAVVTKTKNILDVSDTEA